MSIVVEEADESEFWLEFALEEGIVNKVDAENYYMKPIKSLQFSLQQDEHHNKTKKPSKNHKSQITSHFTNHQSHFTLHQSSITSHFTNPKSQMSSHIPGAIIIEGHVQGLSNARALGEVGILYMLWIK